MLYSFTSAGYATYYRASLSRNAQEYLRKAQNIIAYGSWSGGTYGLVIGF